MAEARRHESLVHLKKLLEQRSRFSIMAKDENRSDSCFLPRGHVNLNYSGAAKCLKKSLGKCCCCCEPSVFGDVVCLMKCFHIDKRATVTGRLPSQVNNGKKTVKSCATDARWIMKTLAEKNDKQNF